MRGLEYYTGPVFEAELTFEAAERRWNRSSRFGSVGGGGRYDGLVSRFKGQKIPATGFSIGVSRLYAALQTLGKLKADIASGPVVVLVMDRDRVADYNRMARSLREAPLDPNNPDGPRIRAEMYLGTSGLKAQMKYADKRGAPCVVIQGGDELARGEVTIKDLIEGERLSAEIGDNQAWREGRPAQFSVKEEGVGRSRALGYSPACQSIRLIGCSKEAEAMRIGANMSTMPPKNAAGNPLPLGEGLGEGLRTIDKLYALTRRSAPPSPGREPLRRTTSVRLRRGLVRAWRPSTAFISAHTGFEPAFADLEIAPDFFTSVQDGTQP